jgi:hypothetical protein
VLQAFAAQANPPVQTAAAGVTQEPPEQTAWPIELFPEQVGPVPQFFVGYEQLPSALPAQVPPQVASVPQDARLPCGFPEATGVQMPR